MMAQKRQSRAASRRSGRDLMSLSALLACRSSICDVISPVMRVSTMVAGFDFGLDHLADQRSSRSCAPASYSSVAICRSTLARAQTTPSSQCTFVPWRGTAAFFRSPSLFLLSKTTTTTDTTVWPALPSICALTLSTHARSTGRPALALLFAQHLRRSKRSRLFPISL